MNEDYADEAPSASGEMDGWMDGWFYINYETKLRSLGLFGLCSPPLVFFSSPLLLPLLIELFPCFQFEYLKDIGSNLQHIYTTFTSYAQFYIYIEGLRLCLEQYLRTYVEGLKKMVKCQKYSYEILMTEIQIMYFVSEAICAMLLNMYLR